MNNNNKNNVIRLLDEVWSRGLLEPVDELIAEQYTIFHDPGDPWDGKTIEIAEYKNRLITSRAPFPDQVFHLREIMADSEKVFITWDWTGTHVLPVAGLPATNKKITMSGATVYYCENARLRGHWQITDRLGVYRQLTQRQA